MGVVLHGGMDVIGITVWNGIVAPLFDASCFLCIIRADDSRKMVATQSMTLAERVQVCSNEQVTTVICGAISNAAQQLLEQQHIQLISWICGPVEALLEKYRQKGNIHREFAMPGCARRGRRRNRGAFPQKGELNENSRNCHWKRSRRST